MWSDVLTFLQSAQFVDILLPGSVDRAGPFPVCRPLTLAFGVYLYDEDLRNDPDEDLVAASVGAHYLTAPGARRCMAMRLFTNNESDPEDGVFRAAEMTFEGGCTVFFDPFWADGIRLGTGNTPDLWLAEHRSPRLKETTWLPAR